MRKPVVDIHIRALSDERRLRGFLFGLAGLKGLLLIHG
jgi:hypothetical protein